MVWQKLNSEVHGKQCLLFLLVKTGTCPYGMFQCKASKKCIIRQFACDGEFDCGEDENGKADSSDEENCGSMIQVFIFSQCV